jgi:hypothetical protein
MRRILLSVICLAPSYFSHIISKTARFCERKVLDHKMCVLIFSTTFVRNISHSKNNSARYYYKCKNVFEWNIRYSCRILIKLGFSRQIFARYSNTKFHEKPCNGSRAVPCGNGRTDVTKLTVAFRNVATAPKRCKQYCFLNQVPRLHLISNSRGH